MSRHAPAARKCAAGIRQPCATHGCGKPCPAPCPAPPVQRLSSARPRSHYIPLDPTRSHLCIYFSQHFPATARVLCLSRVAPVPLTSDLPVTCMAAALSQVCRRSQQLRRGPWRADLLCSSNAAPLSSAASTSASRLRCSTLLDACAASLRLSHHIMRRALPTAPNCQAPKHQSGTSMESPGLDFLTHLLLLYIPG